MKYACSENGHLLLLNDKDILFTSVSLYLAFYAHINQVASLLLIYWLIKWQLSFFPLEMREKLVSYITVSAFRSKIPLPVCLFAPGTAI